MKKIIFFLLFSPLFMAAQEAEKPKTLKHEFAFSPLPTLKLMNVNVENQPFFLEYKRFNGKRYTRVGVRNYFQFINPLSPDQAHFSIGDTALVFDKRNKIKNRGYLTLGTEIQKNIKSNPKVRFRASLDALLGIKSESQSGYYQILDLKRNKSTYLDNTEKTVTKLSIGSGGCLGVDILLGKRTYLGINAYASITLSGIKNSDFETFMNYSPYLAIKF